MFQRELERLNQTLQQIEKYNEEMKSEIAVTRRVTYAAEQAAQKLEKAKLEQDLYIDRLQETLKQKHQQLSMLKVQLTAQQKETQAAVETLNEAAREMESIHFEKKNLAQHWKSALVGIAKRDEALSATQEAIAKQKEEAMNVTSEIEGVKKDVVKEQQRNEQLMSLLRKVQGEAQYLEKQIKTLLGKQEACQVQFVKLSKALEEMEETLAGEEKEGKKLDAEQSQLDRQQVMVANAIQELQNQLMGRLSEEVTLEKSAQKAIEVTKKLQDKVRQEELTAINLQNELAKVEVDVLNTQSHNDQLQQTLKLLDDELAERASTIEKYQQEIRRRNDEIDKKAKYVDFLNKQYDKLTANMEDENMGPLEATIKNLQKEIHQKTVEGKALQHRWIQFQTQLVGVVNENNQLEEKTARQKSEFTVVMQKRARMEKQYDGAMKDVKQLEQAMSRMQNEMTRINELIAKNKELQDALERDNTNLTGKILADLKEMEMEAARMEARIDASKEEKRGLMSEIVETERAIMLWERKLQLEKEMQDAIDPDVGNEVVAAMKKEIHRMRLRFEELKRLQEKLITEMERAIVKREIISTKGKSLANSKHGAAHTVAGVKKQVADLKRSIRETEKEAVATDGRIGELEQMRAAVAEESERVSSRCYALRQEEEDLQAALARSVGAKTEALVRTATLQRMAKRCEEAVAGRYQPAVPSLDPDELARRFGEAEEGRAKILQALKALRQNNPDMASTFDRLIAQASS